LATTVRFMLRVADEQLNGLKESADDAPERAGQPQ
jgi:hypothetical protein